MGGADHAAREPFRGRTRVRPATAPATANAIRCSAPSRSWPPCAARNRPCATASGGPARRACRWSPSSDGAGGAACWWRSTAAARPRLLPDAHVASASAALPQGPPSRGRGRRVFPAVGAGARDQGLSRHGGAGGRAPRRAAVFNLTPALLLQLEDLAARGAKDRYWVATEIPAARLTADDRRFLLERFFDVNPRVIARFRATGSWPTTAPAAASTRLWTRGRSRTSATCRCCSTSPGPIRTSWPPRLWRRWWSVAWAMPRRTRRPCWQSTGESSAR